MNVIPELFLAEALAPTPRDSMILFHWPRNTDILDLRASRM